MRVLAALLLVLAACNSDTGDLEAARAAARARAEANVAAAKEACTARGQQVFEFEGGEWVCGAEAKAERDREERTWSERCSAAGTQVYRGGLEGWFCANPTTDAGQECRAADDCQSSCMLADPGDRRGKCAPLTTVLGCYDFLDENGRAGTICVD